MPPFATLIRRYWIGFAKAIAAYAINHPVADLDQILEDLGWNDAQDVIAANDTNYVPQSRTIL